MSETKTTKPPKVKVITTEYTFDVFDSLLLIDAGSDGFRLKDGDGVIVPIPTGVPISIPGPVGRAGGPITIMAPETGSLVVSAIYYT